MESLRGCFMVEPIYHPGLGALLVLWALVPRSALSTLRVLLIFLSRISGSPHVTLVTCRQDSDCNIGLEERFLGQNNAVPPPIIH
jgi:hypothetical protein